MYFTLALKGDAIFTVVVASPSARSISDRGFVRDGKIVITPISEYIARAFGKPAADEAKRKRRITSVEVVGNAAVGRIELDYPTTTFIDYMTLLKENGRWVIIAKSFHSTPKAS